MMTQEQSKAIWDLIKHIDIAMLTTRHGDQMRARPMYQVQEKFDGTIWFLTSENSAKADELQENNQVCLAYSDPGLGTFVSVSGSAGLNKDKALINKFWNDKAAQWIDGDGGAEDVTLLEVYVEKAEVWDTETGSMQHLFEVLKSSTLGSRAGQSEHRRYG